jgi:predicted aspartyl protease
MQSGKKLYYRVVVETADGKSHLAATKLDNLSIARRVIEELSLT